MEEPKKIVLILGNGFDLDLGLKTSYKDFWESEFCPKDYPAPIIAHLNEKWADDLNKVKWYDLENELFVYYRDIVSKGHRIDVINQDEAKFLKIVKPELWHYGTYSDFVKQAQSLLDKGYISFDKGPLKMMRIQHHKDMLESPEWRDRQAFHLIKEGLCSYLKSLSGQPFNNQSVALSVLLSAYYSREAGDYLNIYTFNYTSVIEDNGPGFHNEVRFIHGNCNNGNIIIGTRDDAEYSKDYDFLQKSFDPNYNPPALVADLIEADEVIIFGHSIGENDRQYFKAFFKQQTDQSHFHQKEITVFTLDDCSEVEIKRSLQKMTDSNLSTLFGLNHVEIIKTSQVKEKPDQLKAFLYKHIPDEALVNITLLNLLD